MIVIGKKNNLFVVFLLISISVLLTSCDSGITTFENRFVQESNNTNFVNSNINFNYSDSYLNYSNSPNKLKFGVEGVSYDEFGTNPSLWFRNAKKRGVSIVSFDPFDIELGLTIIDSATLKNMGFVLDSDFPLALEKIFLAAKDNNIEIILMIEALAHAKEGFLNPSDSIKKDKITPKSLGKFIEELSVIADNNGIKISISEEAYEGEFLTMISSSTKTTGIKYVHFFDDLNCNADTVLSEDYGYYFKDLRKNIEDKEQAKKNIAIGSYFGELGFLNIMYGGANTCRKNYGTLTAGGWGLGAKTHQNIALLRSIQFTPSSVFFVLAEDAEGNTLDGEANYVANYDFSNLEKLINEYGRKDSDSKKPIANLVIDAPDPNSDSRDYFDLSLLSSASTITNSMLAAGFDLSVSKKPIKDADLYYIFSSGFIFKEGKDLSTNLLNLKDKNVPVFYQVAGEISKELTPNWDSLLTQMDIKNYIAITDESGSFEPIPLKSKATFPNGEFEFNYAGYTLEVEDLKQLGYFSKAHTLHFIEPKSTTSEVLLSGFTSKDMSKNFKDESALIIKKDNIYFVNGGNLHFATVPFLTNLMAKKPIFNQPSYAYVTTGKNRNVFFTAYSTKLDLNLVGGSKITEFDETGKKVIPKSSLNGNNLKGQLDKFHLLIVD